MKRRYRSAETGRAVTEEYAKAHPSTTIAETRRETMSKKKETEEIAAEEAVKAEPEADAKKGGKHADFNPEKPSAFSEPVPAEAEMGNDIPESSLTSAVTSDLPAAGEDAAAQDEAYKDQSPMAKAGLGQITVDGGGFVYVGVAPARDKDPETPDGRKITPSTSTFKALADVPFNRSIRVKDPKSGEFYYPGDDATSWESTELNGSYLVPRK